MVKLDLENILIGFVLLIGAYLLVDSLLFGVINAIISSIFSIITFIFGFTLFVLLLGGLAAASITIYGAYKLYAKYNTDTESEATDSGIAGTTTDTSSGKSIEDLKDGYASGELSDEEFERELEKQFN